MRNAMRRRGAVRLAGACLLLLSSRLVAQARPDADSARVALALDAGFVQASGNSEVTTFNFGESLAWRLGRGRIEQQLAYVYGRSEGVTNADLFRTSVRLMVDLSPRIGAYAIGAFDRNPFAGIARRFEEGAGVSVLAWNAPRNRLVLESGVSLFQQTATETIGTGTNRFAAGRFAADYRHTFSERARLTQQVELLPNFRESRDLRINTETALVAPLMRRLSLRMSYVLRYDRLPEDALRTTDRLFTSGLQFSI